jgi:hypothetical protein
MPEHPPLTPTRDSSGRVARSEPRRRDGGRPRSRARTTLFSEVTPLPALPYLRLHHIPAMRLLTHVSSHIAFVDRAGGGAQSPTHMTNHTSCRALAPALSLFGYSALHRQARTYPWPPTLPLLPQARPTPLPCMAPPPPALTLGPTSPGLQSPCASYLSCYRRYPVPLSLWRAVLHPTYSPYPPLPRPPTGRVSVTSTWTREHCVWSPPERVPPGGWLSQPLWGLSSTPMALRAPSHPGRPLCACPSLPTHTTMGQLPSAPRASRFPVTGCLRACPCTELFCNSSRLHPPCQSPLHFPNVAPAPPPYTAAAVARMLLALAGDIHPNPGPRPYTPLLHAKNKVYSPMEA